PRVSTWAPAPSVTFAVPAAVPEFAVRVIGPPAVALPDWTIAPGASPSPADDWRVIAAVPTFVTPLNPSIGEAAATTVNVRPLRIWTVPLVVFVTARLVTARFRLFPLPTPVPALRARLVTSRSVCSVGVASAIAPVVISDSATYAPVAGWLTSPP